MFVLKCVCLDLIGQLFTNIVDHCFNRRLMWVHFMCLPDHCYHQNMHFTTERGKPRFLGLPIIRFCFFFYISSRIDIETYGKTYKVH